MLVLYAEFLRGFTLAIDLAFIWFSNQLALRCWVVVPVIAVTGRGRFGKRIRKWSAGRPVAESGTIVQKLEHPIGKASPAVFLEHAGIKAQWWHHSQCLSLGCLYCLYDLSVFKINSFDVGFSAPYDPVRRTHHCLLYHVCYFLHVSGGTFSGFERNSRKNAALRKMFRNFSSWVVSQLRRSTGTWWIQAEGKYFDGGYPVIPAEKTPVLKNIDECCLGGEQIAIVDPVVPVKKDRSLLLRFMNLSRHHFDGRPATDFPLLQLRMGSLCRRWWILFLAVPSGKRWLTKPDATGVKRSGCRNQSQYRIYCPFSGRIQWWVERGVVFEEWWRQRALPLPVPSWKTLLWYRRSHSSLDSERTAGGEVWKTWWVALYHSSTDFPPSAGLMTKEL